MYLDFETPKTPVEGHDVKSLNSFGTDSKTSAHDTLKAMKLLQAIGAGNEPLIRKILDLSDE